MTLPKLSFVLGMPFSLRQKRLAAERTPLTQEEFVDRVASSELGQIAAGIVWDKLLEAAVVEGFRPYPNDDLLQIYGLADEDLDEDIILETLIATGRAVPNPEYLKAVGPIKSPMDIVRFIESLGPKD